MGRKKVGTIMNFVTLKCLCFTQLGCSLAMERTFVDKHKRRQASSKQLWGSPTENACSRETQEEDRQLWRKNCIEEVGQEIVKEGSSR